MREDDISENGRAWEDDLQVRSASVFCAVSLRLLAGSGSRVVRVVIESIDDSVVSKGELLSLVCELQERWCHASSAIAFFMPQDAQSCGRRVE